MHSMTYHEQCDKREDQAISEVLGEPKELKHSLHAHYRKDWLEALDDFQNSSKFLDVLSVLSNQLGRESIGPELLFALSERDLHANFRRLEAHLFEKLVCVVELRRAALNLRKDKIRKMNIGKAIFTPLFMYGAPNCSALTLKNNNVSRIIDFRGISYDKEVAIPPKTSCLSKMVTLNLSG